MTDAGPRRPRPATVAFVLDVVIVLTFVVFGRQNHQEPLVPGDVLETAAPFLLALGVSWLPPLGRSRPLRASTGAALGFGTVGLGLLLRITVFGSGISGAFPFVALAYIVGLMIFARLAVGRTRLRAG